MMGERAPITEPLKMTMEEPLYYDYLNRSRLHRFMRSNAVYGIAQECSL